MEAWSRLGVTLKRSRNCLVIEDYEIRECHAPATEFRSVASLHNHSCSSIEDLAPLNSVVQLPFMRPFKRTLQVAFGLGKIHDLDYANLRYPLPITRADVFRVELQNARELGFDHVNLAITDHNEISEAGDQASIGTQSHVDLAVGEELSVLHRDHSFHLGIVGVPPSQARTVHQDLQRLRHSGKLDQLFEFLHSLRCLVILNHPLMPRDGVGTGGTPVLDLLQHFGWAIHALEFNGMRGTQENLNVMELAKSVRKPLVGGGDTHGFSASPALAVSREATTCADLVEVVKHGEGVTLIKPDYFLSLRWKITLRVLRFIACYRALALHKGQPISEVIGERKVALDYAGALSRTFLRVASRWAC